MTKEIQDILSLIDDFESKKISIDYFISSTQSRISLITESELESRRAKMDIVVENWSEENHLKNPDIRNLIQKDLKQMKSFCKTEIVTNTNSVNNLLPIESDHLCEPIKQLIEFYINKNGKIVKQGIRDYHFRETYTGIGIKNMDFEKPNLENIKYEGNKGFCNCHWSEVELIKNNF